MAVVVIVIVVGREDCSCARNLFVLWRERSVLSSLVLLCLLLLLLLSLLLSLYYAGLWNGRYIYSVDK